MIPKETDGLIAAPFTSMRPDGGLNLDMVEPYARWLATWRAGFSRPGEKRLRA